MRAPSIGTALRLGRIAALVVACLLFLHACDRTRRLLPTDVWLELAAAALLAAAAMIAAWFEIVRAERIEEAEELEANDPPSPRADDYLYDTGTHAIRARIARSGNLVIHGREHDGPHPRHEWSWTFRTDSFPAVRNVLGGDGDILDLLEEVVPQLDPDSRADPGAWLRANGITGTYREKGDHPSRTTHKLPILRPGQRRATESARSRLSRSESGSGPETSEPPRRGSRRSGSQADATSARTARSARPESRDPRSGPTRRVEPGRAASAHRRPDATAPGSGPVRAGKRTPEPRPDSHSGPLPAADSGAATRRRRRDEDGLTEHTARPEPARRARQRAAAEDPPDTSIHGTRRPIGDEPPAPGLFSARTGIDPLDPPRSRARLPRPDRSPPPDRTRARPGETAYPSETRHPDDTVHSSSAAYRNHDDPQYDRADHRDPGHDGHDYHPPDSAPDPPRRRGHRYR